MILEKEPPDCRQHEQLDDNSQHKLVSEFDVRVLDTLFHANLFAINVPIVGDRLTLCFIDLFVISISAVEGFDCVLAEYVA